MQTTKKTVTDLLERMPDDCSLGDILYHLYLIQSVRRGIEDAAAGRTLTQEEVEQEMRRKWNAGAA